MPPFQSRSTGALSMALISSLGVSASAWTSRARRTCTDSGIDLAERGQTPPPSEILAVS